jgi:hypothetical protein
MENPEMSTTADAFTTLAEKLGWQTQTTETLGGALLVTIARDDELVDTLWSGDDLLVVKLTDSVAVKTNRLGFLLTKLAQ